VTQPLTSKFVNDGCMNFKQGNNFLVGNAAGVLCFRSQDTYMYINNINIMEMHGISFSWHGCPPTPTGHWGARVSLQTNWKLRKIPVGEFV